MGRVATQTTKVPIGHLTVELESERIHNEILDTKVYIGGVYLCVIAGSDIQQFVDEFKALVQKYKI